MNKIPQYKMVDDDDEGEKSKLRNRSDLFVATATTKILSN